MFGICESHCHGYYSKLGLMRLRITLDHELQTSLVYFEQGYIIQDNLLLSMILFYRRNSQTSLLNSEHSSPFDKVNAEHHILYLTTNRHAALGNCFGCYWRHRPCRITCLAHMGHCRLYCSSASIPLTLETFANFILWFRKAQS